MPRLPVLLASALLACGDSGSDTAATSMLTTVSASATTTASSVGDTTAPPTSDASAPTADTTGIVGDTTGTNDDTTTTDDTTGVAEVTTAADTSSTTTTTTTDATTTAAADESTSTSSPALCGDGLVDPGETCDDGVTLDCAGTHDGGDGTCVPAGECSPGYILADAACVPEQATAHVHIMVSNTCEMMVDPAEFSVQPGQILKLEYHNHSVDYPVDVWMHYNGGFLDLQPGATWMEQYEHCFGPAPSEGYADISTACSDFHLPIHCL